MWPWLRPFPSLFSPDTRPIFPECEACHMALNNMSVRTHTHTHTDTPSTGLADEQPVTNGRRQSKRDATALHLFKLEKAANYGDQKTVVRENDIIIL